MTDFNLTFVGPRGESVAELARRLGLVGATASEPEALMAVVNRTVAVAAAATANVALASAPATLDGVALTLGARVLLPAQTAATENGVYVFNGVGTALTRWAGADAWHELPGLTAGVAGGAAHANTAWTCFSPQGGTLGATPVTFLKLAGSLSALLALANTWSNLNIFSEGIGVFGLANVTTVASGYTNALTIEQSGTGADQVAGATLKNGTHELFFQQNNAAGGGVAIIGTLAADPLTFRTGNTEVGRFLPSGSFGIGTQTPSGRVHVVWSGSGYSDAAVIEQSGISAGYVASLAIKAGGNTLLVQQAGSGDGDLAIIGTTSAAPLTFRTNNAERWRIGVTSGHLTPGADNSQNIGSPSARAAVIYAGTGTINTSDGGEKTAFGPIPPGVAAAASALMGRIGVYQWLASVAEKGPDNARLHIGLKAQDVRDAFLDEGEDATRWGLFCEDAIMAPVTRTRMVERSVTERRTVAQTVIVVEDGMAIQRIVEEVVEEAIFDQIPVVDEAGQPVLREVPSTDEAGEPTIVQEPLLHPVPVTEMVEEDYEVMEPTGETRLGLRHEQLLMLFLAVLAERG